MVFSAQVAILLTGDEYHLAQLKGLDITACHTNLQHKVVMVGLQVFGELIRGIRHTHTCDDNTTRYTIGERRMLEILRKRGYFTFCSSNYEHIHTANNRFFVNKAGMQRGIRYAPIN